MYFASSFLGLQCMVGAIRQRQYRMLCHRSPLPHNKPHGSSRECCQRKSVSPSQQTWPTFWYCNMTPSSTKVTLKNQLINWVIQKKKKLIMYLVNLRFCFEPLDSYSGLHVASGHQVGHTWICDKVQVLRIQSPPKGSTSEHHCTGDQAFNWRPSGAP